MVYDSHRDKIILIGGFGGSGFKGDTWQYDSNEWVQIADTGPPPRAVHAMVYDSDTSRTILFGGGNETSFMNDTWEWDGTE
ncbi:MAG TPA: kelch repeat-containing protein [Nitrososphaeraceae archaeon]|jgi:hypothetical protein